MKLSAKAFCTGLPGAMKCHSWLLAPAKHDVRGEFGAVSRDDQVRVAAMLGDPVQFSGDPAA